jgi:hypothetical protein
MRLICSLLGLQALQQSNTITTTIRPCWSELAIHSLLTMLGLFYSAQFYMHTRVCSKYLGSFHTNNYIICRNVEDFNFERKKNSEEK